MKHTIVKTLLALSLMTVFAIGCKQNSEQTNDKPKNNVENTRETSETHSNHEESTSQTQAVSAEDGEKLYKTSCAACHGPDAKGVQNLGKSLVGTDFMKGTSDELVAFVKKGRESGDPANTTGVAMPPKGGNPALTDEQLNAIVTYLKGLS